MSAPTTAPCTLGLTPDNLSAWRDHTLPPTEEQRISAHISACAACQRITAADDALAATLAADQPPAPDPRNWSRLRARIAANDPATAALRHTPRRALWSGLAATAAVLLISALFFNLFGQLSLRRGANSHHKIVVAATPPALVSLPPTAPITGPALNWQYHSAPESVIPPPGNQTYDNGFGFSPTDARTAYICSTTNAYNHGITAPLIIWATHDGAVTWKHVSDLPVDGEVAECLVTVDANDPLRLMVSVSAQNSTTLRAGMSNSISDDGGATWRAIGEDFYPSSLATTGGVSVALLTPVSFDVTPNQPVLTAHIKISRDDWRTSQAIDGALMAQGLQLWQMWQRPGDGAILALTRHRSANPVWTPGTVGLAPMPFSLWQTTDLGAHWTPLPTPPNLTANTNVYNNFVVAPSSGADPWNICGYATVGSGASQTGLLGCTSNAGQTWISRPLPALMQSCGNGCMQQQTLGDVTSLLPDGSLVTVFVVDPTGQGIAQNLGMSHIMRLAPHASHWQDLGSLPSNGIVEAGATNAVLISYSGGMSVRAEPGGSLVGHLGGNVPNRGVFAITTLP